MFGNLSVVASDDIGNAGPHEGPPAEFHWSIIWNIFYFSPWIILVMLLFTRQNRRERAWTILFPLMALHGLPALRDIRLIRWSVNTGYENLTEVIGIIAVAMSIVWALSYLFEKRSRLGSFISSTIIMALVILLGAMSNMDVQYKLLLNLMALDIWLALLITSIICGRRYTPRRFLLWLMAWLTMGVLVLFPMFYVGLIVRLKMPWQMILEPSQLPALGYVALIICVAVHVTVLPFAALAYWHKTYRNRLYSTLRLPGMECQTEQTTGAALRVGLHELDR